MPRIHRLGTGGGPWSKVRQRRFGNQELREVASAFRQLEREEVLEVSMVSPNALYNHKAMGVE
jgi:hypothetical protein